jgi:SAM-dependent methyltransferase
VSEGRIVRRHSAEFFGPDRDHWWNSDHLELIASRLELDAVRSVLDVGSGVGHWGRLLAQVVPSVETIVGVDLEPAWVLEATRRAEETGLGDRFQYREGTAEALPFPDDSFDLVTCQTVLIHVADPRAVIGEMMRVTKPGGSVLAAEPNNLTSALIESSVSAGADIEAVIERLRFMLRCERGKAALGEGNNSIGDLVPGYLAAYGAVEIHTFMADKPAALVPPYGSDAQQALREYVLRQVELGTWGWARDDAQRYFIAGGGTAAQFDASWERRLAERRSEADALTDGTYYSAGGAVLYLIAGRKPPTTTDAP